MTGFELVGLLSEWSVPGPITVSDLTLMVHTVSEEIDRMSYAELDSFLGALEVSLLPSPIIVFLLGALGPYRGVLLEWDAFLHRVIPVLSGRYPAEDVDRMICNLGLKMS